jgi:hypothetical protein
MEPKARLCLKCSRFQSFRDQLFAKFDFSVLITLVPLVTLAAAFLNQTIIRPYSELSAHVSRCTTSEAVLALSNAGTRDAIIEGGTAAFVPANDDFSRALNPPGEQSTPIVIARGQSQVKRFTFADPQNFQPMAAPILTDTNSCTYQIKLNVLEFGGRRQIIDAGQCKCG